MKYIVVAALSLFASVEGKHSLHQPVEDTFVWLNEADAGGNLRRVAVTRPSNWKSPGKFLEHRWDLIQGCLGQNSNEEEWANGAHPAYKTDLQLL